MGRLGKNSPMIWTKNSVVGVVRSAHLYDVIMIIIRGRSPESRGSGGSAPSSRVQGQLGKNLFGRDLMQVILLLALGAGTATILIIIILCLKKKYGWGKKAEYNVNVENFLKNQEFLAPKRYSYSQIKKMTNYFEVKIGQGGFESNMSTLTCPESFSCPRFAPFKYPFYNDIDEGCGLIKVKCNSKGGQIQIGEKKYEIFGRLDYTSSSVAILNTTFEKLVNDTSCEALMNNFTSPNPLLYSISIIPFLTLFKCAKNTSYAEGTHAYFNQPNYNSYNRCKDHMFYYEYSISNATVPSDLPRACEVIQLPVKSWEDKEHNTTTIIKTDIFSLLSHRFLISISLTSSCEMCHNKGGRCNADKGQFHCLGDKKVGVVRSAHLYDVIMIIIRGRSPESRGSEGSAPGSRVQGQLGKIVFGRDLMQVILLLALGAGTATILIIIILCLKKKYGWGKKAEYNVNVENFLKNQEFLAPKRYSYSQIKKMTNYFEVKLGQGGFGSSTLGASGPPTDRT
ncbi:protein kinase domain-containing protein [Artemisia annua]|uniref:Protein kinase domain-containing protein n=1 Tax=Artemisia annua TaxID=35608 RepID=A0A2U1LJH2_ARTAN|nr:protein kinase domain-containing protein [Artemisia annua]